MQLVIEIGRRFQEGHTLKRVPTAGPTKKSTLLARSRRTVLPVFGWWPPPGSPVCGCSSATSDAVQPLHPSHFLRARPLQEAQLRRRLCGVLPPANYQPPPIGCKVHPHPAAARQWLPTVHCTALQMHLFFVCFALRSPLQRWLGPSARE